MKKQELKKNEERRRNIQNNFKHSNIRIIGVPKGEEKEQEINSRKRTKQQGDSQAIIRRV